MCKNLATLKDSTAYGIRLQAIPKQNRNEKLDGQGNSERFGVVSSLIG